MAGLCWTWGLSPETWAELSIGYIPVLCYVPDKFFAINKSQIKLLRFLQTVGMVLGLGFGLAELSISNKLGHSHQTSQSSTVLNSASTARA